MLKNNFAKSYVEKQFMRMIITNQSVTLGEYKS